MRRSIRSTRTADRTARRSLISTRSSATAGAAAVAVLALAASPASAHDCFVPVHNLNAPQSANWETINAEQIAGFMDFEAPCPAAAQAGYAALKAARLPVAVKIYLGSNANEEHMTIGSHSANPNLADGKGLENFVAGSELPFQIAGAWVEAASAHPC